jgi:DNA modification methylase
MSNTSGASREPPFNSNRGYNVIFANRDTLPSADAAQIQAFDDTWHWTPVTDQQYTAAVNGELPGRVADVLVAMRTLLGENDAMAYLVNMAPRLVELHRVVKSTGSLYLHCDPTMSHYLKIILDAIFGATNFRNEIIWKRAHTVKGNAGQGSKHFGRSTDTILYYTKGEDYTFNQVYTPYGDDYLKRFGRADPNGRRYRTVSMIGPGGAAKGNPFYEVMGVSRYWRFSEARMQEMIAQGLVVQSRQGSVPESKQYLDDGKGVAVQSLWTDIISINPMAAERLGYPTQKPLTLLERIIEVSSNEGDVVLDPFCGCGTTIDAAVRLKRNWAGIDITYIAVDLIEKRLAHTHGDSISDTYGVFGIPRDLGGAHALFDRSPFDFERWAVSLINAQPNQKQVGDKGVDGVARFPLDAKGAVGRVLASVKGGKTIGPQFMRDLLGTVQTQKAEMGVLITMAEPTRGIIDAAAHAGSYVWPINGESFPQIQIVTVAELLAGKKPKMPATLTPYIQAQKLKISPDQMTLGI